MTSKFAIAAVLLAFAASRCEASPCEDSDPDDGGKRYLEETGNQLSTGDILEEMLDYMIAEDDIFEGRKKKKLKKKLMKYLAGALLLKAILLPKIFALIKFLTAKAYLVSLLALIFAASVTSKKPEQNTEHIINLVPKGKGRDLEGQQQAYRYWRRGEPEGV